MKKKKKAKAKAKSKVKVKAKAKSKAKKAVRAKAKPKKAKKSASKAKGRQKPASKPKLSVIPPANSVLLGRVEDYFAHIGVIALTLQQPIRSGDHLHILGHTTNLEQTVDSMQIDHQSVNEAAAKAEVGIKVTSRVRRRDYVFLIKG